MKFAAHLEGLRDSPQCVKMLLGIVIYDTLSY